MEKELSSTFMGNTNSETNSTRLRLIDVLFILIPWKRKIFFSTLIVMILTTGISFLMDKWYESKAVIMLPEKSLTTLESLGGALGGLGQNLLGGTSGGVGPQRYIAILKSRRLKESVIEKFDLINAFEMQATLKDTIALIDLLEEIIVAESNIKNGTITITVRFKNEPNKSAEIANFIVSKLDEINRELSAEQARSSRMFIEKRYIEAREELKKSEDRLNKFQNNHGVIALPEQTKASIEASAAIQAQIAATETEYNVLKKTLSESHPDLMRMRSKIEELSKIKKKLEVGGSDMSVLIPFKDTPDLALEYLRLFREVQINQKIAEFLVPQYEQAKIQEARDTPTLLVLDKGKPAAKPYKPNRILIVFLMGLFTASVFIVLIVAPKLVRNSKVFENEKAKAIIDAFSLRGLINK